MNFKQIETTDTLKDYINCFWYTERVFVEDNPFFEILPDGFAELIFFFGASCSVKKKDGLFLTLSSPFIVGLLDQPVRLKIQGHIQILALRFYPWTIFSLLNITPQINDALQFVNSDFKTLSDFLETRLSIEQPIDVLNRLQNFFTDYFSARKAPDTQLLKVGRRIRENQGIEPIHKLAAETAMTLKTLERNLKKTSGNSAKALTQKVRFEKVRNYIWANPSCILKSLALQFEFTDAAHFNREFKRFSGQSPTSFAKKALLMQTLITQNNVEIIQV